MSRSPTMLRLFVAIYPPLDIARDMLDAMRRLSLAAHRSTPAEQVHLTLQFIGDTPVREMKETIASVERSVAGLEKFSLRPLHLVAFPERRPARLIAAETDAPPGLLEIHRRLATRLANNVRQKPGDRYRPHLTLCRFRSPVSGYVLNEPLCLTPFEVDRVLLMRSTLSAAGAVHEEVAAALIARTSG